jgi:DNA segregation ATPase FtsK/SpoIIIE-like protein
MLAYQRAHRAWKTEQDRKYLQRHPEKSRMSYRRKYAAKRERYRELARERTRRWREKNKALIEVRRDDINAAQRARREKDPGRYRAYDGKHGVARRTRVEQQTPQWAEHDKIAVVYRQAEKWGFEVDHIVPIRHPLVSGLHVWANLQLLARGHNRRKKNGAWPDMAG